MTRTFGFPSFAKASEDKAAAESGELRAKRRKRERSIAA
jgi:hypothetical protein